MNHDPLDALRTSIDDSMSPAAAERVWNRAQRRNRELRQSRTRWAKRAVAAIACATAALAPAVLTSSSSTAESHLPAPTVSVPGAFAQLDNQHTYSGQESLVPGKYWCSAGHEPDDTVNEFALTAGQMYATAVSLCFVATSAQSPTQAASFKFVDNSEDWIFAAQRIFPELWWSKYALLSHGFQLCYSFEEGRVAVIPVTFPDGQPLRCQNLFILKMID